MSNRYKKSTAPKYIQALALQLENQDKRETETEWYTSAETFEEVLMDLRTALLKDRYYTSVLKVSKSGMSRTIAIAYIKNNELYRLGNKHILALACVNKNGRIEGTGMDMLFHAQYTLFRYVCPNHDHTKSMTRYRSLIHEY